MKLPTTFISCDWGTSNFRLRLVETESLAVLSEHKTDVGIKKHFQEFKAQDRKSREIFFVDYLMAQIKELNGSATVKPIVVASGMLSSSIGMKELPYAEMPISFSGEELISESVQIENSTTLVLVSGAKTKDDVMRGEEIQAIGLADSLPKKEQGLLLLPGTHSKHIKFENGRFVDFTTYMTGELFDVISKHSILAASLTKAEWNSTFKESFLKGVGKGLADQQMASLFSIRAKSLIDGVSGERNFYFLSGLLIGGELSGLKNTGETVYLAASGIYNQLYRLALESFLPKQQIEIFTAGRLEKAVRIGQRKIMKLYA